MLKQSPPQLCVEGGSGEGVAMVRSGRGQSLGAPPWIGGKCGVPQLGGRWGKQHPLDSGGGGRKRKSCCCSGGCPRGWGLCSVLFAFCIYGVLLGPSNFGCPCKVDQGNYPSGGAPPTPVVGHRLSRTDETSSQIGPAFHRKMPLCISLSVSACLSKMFLGKMNAIDFVCKACVFLWDFFLLSKSLGEREF